VVGFDLARCGLMVVVDQLVGCPFVHVDRVCEFPRGIQEFGMRVLEGLFAFCWLQSTLERLMNRLLTSGCRRGSMRLDTTSRIKRYRSIGN